MKRFISVVTIFAFCVAGAASASAHDVDNTMQQTSAGRATEDRIVRGGTPQSTDPTRWDYVPDQDEGIGKIQPMSADGVQYISAFRYTIKGVSIPVPSGYLIHSIRGSGLRANSETATYSPAPSAVGAIWGSNICNWRIDFQNRRASNNSIATTWPGETNSGCTTKLPSRTARNIGFVRGVQCARLFVNGVFRGEQCHSVFA